MQIKTNEGNYDVASKGLGNTALGLGIAGLATSLLGGGAQLLNTNGIGKTTSGDERYVSKCELDLVQQLQAKDIELAQKDSMLALKESENYTDKKLVEVYEAINTKVNGIAAEMRANKDEQTMVNANQIAYNATANSQISVLQSQIAGLQSVTKVYIPASNVCNSPCGCTCPCPNA